MNKVLFFLFFSNVIFGQTVNGVIKNNKLAIVGATIKLKNKKKNIDFVFSNSDGFFQFNDIQNNEFVLEISHPNYIKIIIPIKNINKNNIIINLQKSEEVIEEVVVKKEVSIINKKDTVVYKPNAFKDGTERVVEDLLKKLPGINVDDNGKISYNGKEIQSLMLEGDDLFNSQYIIGSRNIDVNLVESVEAISNFNTNKVLHNISESDNVALNLKIKKSKTNLSLNASLENDFFSKYNNSLTALLINHKNKSFNTTSMNNLGINNTPHFNFSKDNFTINKNFLKGRNQEILSQGSLPILLGSNISRINNNFYNYTSYLRNFSKKVKSNFTFGYYKDKIHQNYYNKTDYKIDNNFSSFNEEIQVLKPEILSINNSTVFFNNKNLHIEYKLQYEINNNKLFNDINNNNSFQSSKLNTNIYFFGNKLEVTKQTSKSSAINGILFYSKNNSEQNYFITPSVFQNSNYNKQNSKINAVLFNSNLEFYKNWLKFKIKLSNNLEIQNNKLISSLEDSNYNIDESFFNNLLFENIKNEFKLNLGFNTQSFKIGLLGSFNYQDLSGLDKNVNTTNFLFGLNSKYSINTKNSINLFVNQDVNSPFLKYLYLNNILTSFRSINSNQGELDLIKSNSLGINYKLNDLFNTLYVEFGINYSKKNKDYYYKNEISNNLIFNKSVLLDLDSENFSMNFSFHKFIPFLKSTIKLNSIYSHFLTYNFVNNLNIREIKSNMLNNNLLIYTGFKSKINFQDKIDLQSDYYKANNSNNSILHQIKNEFNVIYNFNDSFNFNTVFETFIPNSNKNQNFNFLSFEMNYKLKKKNIDFYLKGHNLLNVKKFQDVSISDYTNSTYSYSLQERYFLLGFNLKIF